jgi:tRNA dimethylallyltransferase
LKAGFYFPVDPLQFLILAGPTASGKSELAVQIAEQLSIEIVGADAYQIYQGCDLLSGKPPLRLRERIPHHLIGILPITETSDAARYAELASERIRYLNARGIRPLVVGGTGFYLRALTHPLPELPGADPNVRAEFAGRSLESLVDELETRDPICLHQIDRHNRRRVERALEVYRLTGTPFSSFKDSRQSGAHAPALLLERPRDELYRRIDRRVERIFAEGAIDEVRETTRISQTAAQMIGFAEIRNYLAGYGSRQTCIEAIQLATRQYAKRQLTWFRRQNYLSFPASGEPAEAVAMFRNFNR